MKLAYVITGSFCTIERSLETLRLLAASNEMIPVVSRSVATVDTRFGRAQDILYKIDGICGRVPISTLASAEPMGPVIAPDAMIIAPCTGNTLSKLSHGISDTPATLAAKSHLRNNRPLLIALCSNDALTGNFRSLATLYQRKNVYFVPMRQDDVKSKPASLVANFDKIEAALAAAVRGEQLLPLFE